MGPPIAILGAGPSGLLLARLLEQAHIEYVIFERDASATSRRQGSSLDLHIGTGQLALQHAGLFAEFKARARYAGVATTFADKAGVVVARYDTDDSGGEHDRPEIDRWELRALLLRAIPSERVRWDARVEGVERADDSSMSVRLAGGKSETGFKLVVGADGTWSKARSLVTSAQPQYAGRCYLMTTISATNPFSEEVKTSLGHGTYMGLGDTKQIVGQYMGDGSFTVYAGLHLPEDWTSENAALLNNPPALREWLLEHHFSDWAPVNTDLIRKSDGEFVPWLFYAMPQDTFPWKPVPGVTLIGDAAHVTNPDGEGANSALYDSLQLGQRIVQRGLGDLSGAVEEYEKEMFLRSIERGINSVKFGDLIFAPDSPYSFVKNYGHGSVEPVR